MNDTARPWSLSLSPEERGTLLLALAHRMDKCSRAALAVMDPKPRQYWLDEFVRVSDLADRVRSMIP